MNQQERLTEYLEKHGKIDPLKAWTQLGIYRLADTVFNLRKKGYEITTTNKKITVIKQGHRKVSFFVLKFDLDVCLPIFMDE